MMTHNGNVMPSLIGTIASGDGSSVRYLGRADGVYVQFITPDGIALPEQPYAPWSRWIDSDAHAVIESAQRSFCAQCYHDTTDAGDCNRPDCEERNDKR